jgi:hypothetical protein
MHPTPTTTFNGALAASRHRTSQLRIRAALRRRQPVQGRSRLARVSEAPEPATADEWIVGGWPRGGRSQDGRLQDSRSQDGPLHTADSFLYAALHVATRTWFIDVGRSAFLDRLQPDVRRAAASWPGHPWGRPVPPTDRAALPIGGDRLWLEFFGAWPREDTGRVLAAVCSTECSPPRSAQCSPPPWPPADANGSESGGGDGRRTNRRARRLRTPQRRPTRSPAHPWVCIRLQPATADAPYLHARPWMDPARGVTARSAADLVGRVGEAVGGVR